MAKSQKLTGPGVTNFEHCPPMLHFDLSPEELQEFLANPDRTLKRLKLKVTTPVTIVLARWNEAFSEKSGWTGRGKAAMVKGCCIYEGGTIY